MEPSSRPRRGTAEGGHVAKAPAKDALELEHLLDGVPQLVHCDEGGEPVGAFRREAEAENGLDECTSCPYFFLRQ